MLFEKGNPESPLNRRISVIVMNREAEDRFFQAAKIEAIDATDDEALTGEEEPAPDIKPSRPSLTGR
jgi:chemotaxis protein MotB